MTVDPVDPKSDAEREAAWGDTVSRETPRDTEPQERDRAAIEQDIQDVENLNELLAKVPNLDNYRLELDRRRVTNPDEFKDNQ